MSGLTFASVGKVPLSLYFVPAMLRDYVPQSLGLTTPESTALMVTSPLNGFAVSSLGFLAYRQVRGKGVFSSQS